MIVVRVAVYVLAGIGVLCVASMTGFVLLLARDLRCVRRTRLVREGKPLNGRERRELARLEREVNSSGS